MKSGSWNRNTRKLALRSLLYRQWHRYCFYSYVDPKYKSKRWLVHILNSILVQLIHTDGNESWRIYSVVIIFIYTCYFAHVLIISTLTLWYSWLQIAKNIATWIFLLSFLNRQYLCMNIAVICYDHWSLSVVENGISPKWPVCAFMLWNRLLRLLTSIAQKHYMVIMWILTAV